MTKIERKFAVIIASVLILSAGISIAISLGYTSMKELEEKLIVTICPDRTPSGVEPLTLNLSAKVINAKGKVSYKWDFGNGETSTEKEVTVTYDEPGEYECTLVVTDESGRKGEDHIKVIVKENRPPIVILTINKKTIDRKLSWIGLLSKIPILNVIFRCALPGDRQKYLDRIEKRKGPWAWGESGIVVTAQINDPEGDKIVSYEWKVQTADKLLKSGGGTVLPVHNLTGNETVKIPALYAWIAGRHIVTLTVKDSAGNTVTASTDFMVSESKLETYITLLGIYALYLPNILKIIEWLGHIGWTMIIPDYLKEKWYIGLCELYSNIEKGENIWSHVPKNVRDIILKGLSTIPSALGIPFEPPVDKAELSISDVQSFNFSTYVNPCGLVTENVTLERTFNITNIDTNLTAYEILLSLDKPYSEEKGLPSELEKDGVTVRIKVNSFTRNLFYQGTYTEWEDGMKIDRLSPGDTVECKLIISLKKGTTLEKGIYNCSLYAYQNKTLPHGELVDVIPFEVIV